MILKFAAKHNIACRIYRDAVGKGNEMECFIPTHKTCTTPNMNFFIRDEHCFWYGKPLEETGAGKSCQPDANNGINQMWPDNLCGSTTTASAKGEESDSGDDDGEEDSFNMEEYIQQFCDKETTGFFRKADHIPPFSEWQHENALLHAAPDFKDFQRPAKQLYANSKRVQL